MIGEVHSQIFGYVQDYCVQAVVFRSCAALGIRMRGHCSLKYHLSARRHEMCAH